MRLHLTIQLGCHVPAQGQSRLTAREDLSVDTVMLVYEAVSAPGLAPPGSHPTQSIFVDAALYRFYPSLLNSSVDSTVFFDLLAYQCELVERSAEA